MLRSKAALAALVLSVAMLFSATAFAADGPFTWEQMLPTTTNQSLNGVTFVSSSVGWAVGDAGTVLRSDDAARHWERVPVPGLKDALNDAAFVNTARGWVVGNRGAIVRTVDGGYSWGAVQRPVTTNLLAVSTTSGKTLVAVGERGTIVRSTDGGSTWSKRVSPSPAKLTDVRFFSACTVIAVTDKGSIIRSTDAGKTWAYARKRSATSVPGYVFRPRYRSGIDSVSSRTGWVTGPQGVLQTKDGGRTWKRLSTKGRLEAVDFVTAYTGYAILNADYEEWMPADASAIYKTQDGGRTWRRVYYGSAERGDPPVGQFLSISCASLSRQCVVGGGGTIVYSLDGSKWDEASAIQPAIRDLSWVSATEGWAIRQQVYIDGERVGEMPVTPRSMLKTTDAGATWKEVPSPRGHFGEWVSFASTSTGWFAEYSDNPYEPGPIFVTRDGGSTWTTETAIAGKPRLLDTMRGWAPGEGATIERTADGGVTWQTIAVDLGPAPLGYNGPAAIRDVAFATPQLGWLIGYGRIYVSTDGGDTWRLQRIEDSFYLHELRILSPVSAWASGPMGNPVVYLVTTDAGANWTSPGGLYGRIAAVFPDQGVMFRLDYSGNRHSLSRSTDGGVTWTSEDIGPFRINGVPERLYMADPQRAWLYGDGGMMMRRFPTALVGNPDTAATASVGETVTVGGTFGTDVAELGARVKLRLWKQSGSDWVPRGTVIGTVGDGGYSAAVSFPSAGAWRLRAYHSADSNHNSSSSSGYLTLSVAP